VKAATPRYEIPAEAMPEMKGRSTPRPITPRQTRSTGAIPAEAMPELKGRPSRGRFSVGRLPGESTGGTVLGGGIGSLQGMFRGRKAPTSNPSKADVEGASLGKAIGSAFKTAQGVQRTLWTSLDFSAPMSQGALLSIAHPVKAGGSMVKMFRSLSRAQSDAIDAEIAFHPLRKLGEDAGLYLATSGKLKADASGAEEVYGVESLNRLPGLSHSERAYRTYLDTLRMSTWESYVKALQADGKTFQSDPKAYKDAAAFINIATGRGQLRKGGSLEKASDLMGNVLFAPRNLVANFQVLDPVRYMTLAPGARKLVLRDALTAFGTMVGTAALLRAAGADVGFDPQEDNFMTARLGNTRYDLTFGKKTQVQFLAKLAAGLYRQASGEGNLPGKDPLTVTERFATGKLSPVLGTAKTFLTGKDFKGEKIADKSAPQIAWETAAPMLMRDMAEAYKEEGGKGVLKASPAILGARVNTYPDRAKTSFLDAPDDLRAEQKKFGEGRNFLTPKRGEEGPKPADKPLSGQIADIFRYQGPKPLKSGEETPAQFEARKTLANQWTKEYGSQLVRSDAYKSATSEEQKAAREYLKETITKQSSEKRPALYLLRPAHILQSVRSSQRKKSLR
jgi:hypothetical protein